MATLSIRDLDFGLDVSQFAATGPAEERGVPRDKVKMLVIRRAEGSLAHTKFQSLPDFFEPGDVFVVNTSMTIPARLFATSQGQLHMVHLAARLSANRFIIERRGKNGEADSQAWGVGETVLIVQPEASGMNWQSSPARLKVIRRFHPQSRLWEVESSADLYELAQAIGSPIRYSYLKQETDTSDYETIFGRTPGSAEMPSASRPFTSSVVRRLAAQGVKIASITLHTTVSSHEVESDLSSHPVLPEWFSISPQAATVINDAKAGGHRIVGVGTTAVRAVESAVAANGEVQAMEGWTTRLITPDTPAQIITSLVTGMHDNHTSHLALMYAFISPSLLRHAYHEAAGAGYLWHEFGDISLLL
ncbi:S-adenosylmethionine:tRNA ribosyltransferase-isomerase [Alicyclobacillus curvatus]|jgi:S-adenosylmethionine:tRNA ribosyltransferase-isomerase|nr:S-adenosylmethionine:tRNA ribosyltransferase-isomerase [Alicyclobacillus curvatus]